MRARFVNESIEESEFSPKQKNAIKKFIFNYKGDFKDEDIHNFSGKIGLDKHEVEEYIYSIARKGLKTVNESLSPAEKREEVMKILTDMDVEVAHDSYLKFMRLCKTNLSPEKIVRKLIKESATKNTIKGGKGDKLTKDEVCPKQFAVGKKVEREHTSSDEKAEEITLDHLSENDKYYSELVEKGFVDEGPAIKEYIKQFGKSKLPKKLQENVSFQKGQDPMKKMGVGINNYSGYVKHELSTKYPGKDLKKLEKEFWDLFNDAYEDMRSYEVGEAVLDILEHTPLKFQMEFMDGDLESFEEAIEEGWITI